MPPRSSATGRTAVALGTRAARRGAPPRAAAARSAVTMTRCPRGLDAASVATSRATSPAPRSTRHDTTRDADAARAARTAPGRCPRRGRAGRRPPARGSASRACRHRPAVARITRATRAVRDRRRSRARHRTGSRHAAALARLAPSPRRGRQQMSSRQRSRPHASGPTVQEPCPANRPDSGASHRDIAESSIEWPAMLRFLTAGESHGPALVVIVEGVPAGLAARCPPTIAARPGAPPARLRPRPPHGHRAGPRRDPVGRAPRPDARQPHRAPDPQQGLDQLAAHDECRRPTPTRSLPGRASRRGHAAPPRPRRPVGGPQVRPRRPARHPRARERARNGRARRRRRRGARPAHPLRHRHRQPRHRASAALRSRPGRVVTFAEAARSPPMTTCGAWMRSLAAAMRAAIDEAKASRRHRRRRVRGHRARRPARPRQPRAVGPQARRPAGAGA